MPGEESETEQGIVKEREGLEETGTEKALPNPKHKDLSTSVLVIDKFLLGISQPLLKPKPITKFPSVVPEKIN